MTYDEVINKIPYRNLVVMQHDKIHIAYGTIVKKSSGKEMMKRRMQKLK